MLLLEEPTRIDERALLRPPGPRSWSGVSNGRRRPATSQPSGVRVRIPAPRAAEPPAAHGVTVPVREPAGRRPARRRAGRLVGEVALTLTALLGLGMTGLTVAAAVSGLAPLVVRSGSMEPAIPTGGMVLVRTVPAAQIQVGDVVTVDVPGGKRVTHRVVEVTHDGPLAQLVLKGDANEDVDPQPVTVDDAGLVVHNVPAVGRLWAFFATAKGGFLLGCVVTGVALPAVTRRS